jgi:hypothetical protein
MVKGKLPKHIQKKVEEWKFQSGALVMCLVAYSDGTDIHSFQFVNNISLYGMRLTDFPVWRLLLWLEIHLPRPAMSGGKGHIKISKTGLGSNLVTKNLNLKTKRRFLCISRR